MELNYLPVPGTPRDQLDTPCLVVDLPAMERNLKKTEEFFRNRPSKLRPHTKTHKCPVIAHKQIEHGAIGVCCAKVGEAEAMVLGGIKDIFIPNQVVGQTKLRRLMALCRYADMMVAVDDPANVKDLSEAAQAFGVKLRVTVEVNVRINRCGVEPGQPAVDLAKIVAKSPSLVFAGLMGYEGQVRSPFEERVLETRKAMDKLIASKEAVEKAGLRVKIVSAGSTSTWNITGAIPGITEVQSGTYILMDASYYKHTPDFERALHLLATVISRPRKGLAITDAGLKALSTDEGLPEVVWPKGAKLARLAEEHGSLELEGDEAEQLRPGDKVVILPSHGDTTINLHDYYCALRNGIVEAVWPIAGRGRFR